MTSRPEWQMAKNGMNLDSPYNPDFIQEMKSIIPETERKWIRDKKMWWISDAYLDEVEALLLQYFGDTGYGRE